MENSLSTVNIIEDTISRNIDGFTVVDTMGSMVNNAGFKSGYDDFANGYPRSTSDKAYIWKALSAVADNIG